MRALSALVRPALAIAPATTAAIAPLGAGDAPEAHGAAQEARQQAQLNHAEAQRLAALIQSRYRRAERFEASFVQLSYLRAQDHKTRRRGVIRLERPHKLSIRYLDPKGHRVVSDGERLTVYDADRKVAYRSKADESFVPDMLAFLEGTAVLPRDYHLRVLDLERRQVKAGRILEAVPREPSAIFARILFYVDDAGEVTRVLVVDAQGNYNRFDLARPRHPKDIRDGEFRFRLPRGAKLVTP